MGVVVGGCSSAAFDVAQAEDTGPNADETGSETAPDTAVPETTPVLPDTAPEAAPEATPDTAPDTVPDAGHDTTPADASTDTAKPDTLEAGPDAGPDTADAGPDVGPEVGSDTGTPVICSPSTYRCDGLTPERCNSTGSAWTAVASPCGYGCNTDGSTITCACAATTPRFTKLTDTVLNTHYSMKDSKTGLVWATNPAGECPWSGTCKPTPESSDNAAKVCKLMDPSWRVPTRAELTSIMAYTYEAGPGIPLTCSVDFDPILNFKTGCISTSDTDPVTGQFATFDPAYAPAWNFVNQYCLVFCVK